MPTRALNVISMSEVTDVDLDTEFQKQQGTGKETTRENQGRAGSGTTSSTDSTGSLDRHQMAVSLTSHRRGEEQAKGREASNMPDDSGKRKKNTDNVQSAWQSFKKAGVEFNQDTRRMFRYIGRKLHSRHGPRETKVKEIRILPGEDDDQRWARRTAGSANSRSSSGSGSDPSSA